MYGRLLDEKALSEVDEAINRSSLSLHSSYIALDCSCFCKTIGELVVLSRDIPEPNLDVLSHVLSQHASNVRTNLDILSLMFCHLAIKSKKQIQICRFGTFGRAPVVTLHT